jgi:pyruvate/2-oxoglutarate dehydrogenase complex dihydrolipoamide acyltransferase (E2) component
MVNIILPELGEGIVKAEIVRWNFAEGQTVKVDDDVLELVTDKAVFNVSAPASGVIGKIYYQEGQEAPVGAVLAELRSS